MFHPWMHLTSPGVITPSHDSMSDERIEAIGEIKVGVFGFFGITTVQERLTTHGNCGFLHCWFDASVGFMFVGDIGWDDVCKAKST